MMRKFYPFLFLLLFSLAASSQTRSWNGGNGDWNDKTKWTPIGLPEETDILDFSSASGTITNVPGLHFKGIIVSGADIVFNAAAGDAKLLKLGTDVPGLALNIQADASLTIGNNLNIEIEKNSFAAVDGTLIISTQRQYIINHPHSKTTVTGIIRNSGGIVLSTAATLEFNDGSIYQHAMDKGAIPTATWSKNSNCNIEGVVTAAPANLQQAFGNYKWDCPLQAAGSLPGVAIPGIINGTLTLEKAGATTDQKYFLQLPEKINVGGNFNLNGGTYVVNGTTSTITIAGHFIMTGGVLKANATTTNGILNINFAGDTRQSLVKSGGSIEKSSGAIAKGEVKFTVLENAAIDFGESVLNGSASFQLSKGSKLITAHPDGIAATGMTGSVQVLGARTFSSEAEYVYNGSLHQKTGSGLPAMIKKLVIDNNAGVNNNAGVTLSKPTAISQELLLENGFLHTSSANMLMIMDGASAASYNNAFVEGPMQKTGNTAFVFPTGWSGNGGGLIPIGVSSINSSSIIQAEYKRAPATDKGNTINAPLHHISYCEYWELFPVSGTPSAIITMYRNAHSNCNPVSSVQDFSSVRVARSDGSTWKQVETEDGSMNAGTGYVVSDSAGTLINKQERYFTLGNISFSRDPLPVMYDSVTAYEKNNGVYIEWSNLTERDIATYFVERSTNGEDFAVISQHLPKSNRDDKASYISFDPSPASGPNFYRIKTIEKNTKIIFSRVIRVETDRSPDQEFIVYPNPVTGPRFVLSLAGMKEGKYYLSILSTSGQLIYQKDILNQGRFTTQTLELPRHIKSGIYSVLVKGDNYQQSKIFIVQ